MIHGNAFQYGAAALGSAINLHADCRFLCMPSVTDRVVGSEIALAASRLS